MKGVGLAGTPGSVRGASKNFARCAATPGACDATDGAPGDSR